MEIKETMHAIRLALGAVNAEAVHADIAPEFVPQIEQARERLNLMRGTSVIEALSRIHRSGLSLDIDVRR